MTTPSILILGRPNVGKSTLFNKLIGERKSIVYDFPGVTRDLIFSYYNYKNKNFVIIDSGGISLTNKNCNITNDVFQDQIEENVKEVISSSEIILFLTDSQEGLNPYDIDIARYLRQYKEKVIVAVNKTENTSQEFGASDFYTLGFDNLFFISSTQGIGINAMMDFIIKNFADITSKSPSSEIEKDAIKVSIIGKPNVGKSSIFNALAGKNKAIVSSVAGTTRDSLDQVLTYHQKNYIFIDTAGLKKRNQHTQDSIDFYSYIRTMKAIDKSEVCVFVIDASEPLSSLDKQICNLIIEEGKSIILLVNKWDKVDKDSSSMNLYTKIIYNELIFAKFAPLFYTSAKTRKKLINIFNLIDTTYENYYKRISTPIMNDFLIKLKNKPGFNSTKKPLGKIYYISQVDKAPAKFMVSVNKKEYFKSNFTNFLTNKIYETFGFEGCPIKIYYKEKVKITKS
jgi:GTPase